MILVKTTKTDLLILHFRASSYLLEYEKSKWSIISRSCPVNHTCFPDVGDNPNHGYTSFDAFHWALLCTIQLVTADYWENVYEYVCLVSDILDIMHALKTHQQNWINVQQSERSMIHSLLQIIASNGCWSAFYFLVVIFFGSFYLLNLILAVVAISYQQELANLKNQVWLR